jgi:ribosomal protein S27AE
MNEMCDRCGPAVAAVYRAKRHGELYLCGHCTNRLWPALFAQGWTIRPAREHALARQPNECSGASWQRTRRGRGSGRSLRMLRCRFRRLRALVSACWRRRSRRLASAANPRKQS